MKICPKCKIEKPESDFYKDNRIKTGLESKCKQCKGAYIHKYYLSHKEDKKANNAKFRENNREKLREKSALYYATHKEKFKGYRKTNRTGMLKALEKYRITHRGYLRIYGQNRRAKLKGGIGELTVKMLSEILYQQDNKCYYCNENLENYHIEHLIPLIAGGQHKEYNIVLSCPTCNLSKGFKMPDIFINQQRNNNARSN